jgi:hypothetical protein
MDRARYHLVAPFVADSRQWRRAHEKKMNRAAAEGSYLVKGSVLRAYAASLAKTGLLAYAMERVKPATARSLTDPPLAGTWVDATVIADLAHVVHQHGGDEAVLALAAGALKEQTVQPLVAMVESVLRVVGTSPATVLSRLSALLRTTARGLEIAYAASSDRSGWVTVTHDTPVPLPAASFITTVPVLRLALQICGRSGTVGMPEMAARNQARYRVEW